MLIYLEKNKRKNKAYSPDKKRPFLANKQKSKSTSKTSTKKSKPKTEKKNKSHHSNHHHNHHKHHSVKKSSEATTPSHDIEKSKVADGATTTDPVDFASLAKALLV